MSDDPDILSDSQKEFILDRAASGFEVDEIVYDYNQSSDAVVGITAASVMEFLGSEEGEELMDIRGRVRSKKAAVNKEELIEDLMEVKDELKRQLTELQDQSGITERGNQATDNLMKSIKMIGEYIGELKSTSVENNNVIMVNQSNEYIQNNVDKVVKHLPKEQKHRLVQDLTDDLGLIIQKDAGADAAADADADQAADSPRPSPAAEEAAPPVLPSGSSSEEERSDDEEEESDKSKAEAVREVAGALNESEDLDGEVLVHEKHLDEGEDEE